MRSYYKEAKNDDYIPLILKDPRFKIINNDLYTCLSKNGKSVTNIWRKAGGYDEEGYRCLNTRIFKGQKGFRIHRIIYAALKGPLDQYKAIHHINGIRDDNRPENLALITWFENNRLKGKKHFEAIKIQQNNR